MYPYDSDPSYEVFVKNAALPPGREEVEASEVDGAGNQSRRLLAFSAEQEDDAFSGDQEDEFDAGQEGVFAAEHGRHGDRGRRGGRGHDRGHRRPPRPGGGHGHDRPPGHGGGHGHGGDPGHGGGGGHGHRRPSGAPPSFIPSESASFRAVDSRAISRCLNSFTYVWLMFGHGFWMFPTFVGPRSIAGYRWGRFGWTYTGFDLRAIKSFTCSG
ncbi:MAG: hypothetical protein FWE20_00755 [Defluviitaleaceae bacterium]|nr:hypothetical protein [Defluviitaleaceae bacterium]